MPPDLSLERGLAGIVCGVDEVGRGPLAGPVLAAAVVLPDRLPPLLLERLDDSKRLSRQWREALFDPILTAARVGIGRAEVYEIDHLNILKATFLAMRRAVTDLGTSGAVDHALVDGNQRPHLECQVTCVVKGDSRSLSIAAASVVAKVLRDRIMAALAVEYPGYGWEHNAGYGTAEHLAALRRLGATPHHRKSFAPVAALLNR
jgi:ribonuclease HII